MARIERSIKIAFNKSTGEILNADELFDDKKEGFVLRKQFHDKKLLLNCCECGQDLNISGSKYDRLHFKHQYPHDFCALTDGGLTPREHQEFTRILIAKEGERHKELKNKIGKLLASVNGIDSSTISIDNKFIARNGEKRKPDVYCKFFDKELVFEIQISQLSLGYILNRYNFYRKNGMYLIWILDDFDLKNQGTLERDIKYLAKYENFFKLDESSTSFKLLCDYKYPFITDDSIFLTKWLNKSVSLSEIKFDKESFQIYYYNFGDNKTIVQVELEKKIQEKKQSERDELENQRNEIANRKTSNIIDSITKIKKSNLNSFGDIYWDIYGLTEFELSLLNSKLNLLKRKREDLPILNYWIKNSIGLFDPFLEFILNCKEIEISVNAKSNDDTSLFQEIILNEKIDSYFFIKLLLKRGYKISEEDKELFLKLKPNSSEMLVIYELCSSLTDSSLTDLAIKFYQLLFTIESARINKIVGYRFQNWVALANNAIHHHSEYWEYIELAFKKYGVWNLIIESDKKGTFQKKLNDFYKKIPEQKYDFDEVFRDLYFELEFL